MFSSLPSASKIYLNSTKSKPKSVTSARRKRKKSDAGNTSIENNVDDTLISRSHKLESSFQGNFNSDNGGCIAPEVRSRFYNYDGKDLQFGDTVNGNIDTCEYNDYGTLTEEQCGDIDIDNTNENEEFDTSFSEITLSNIDNREICSQNVNNSLIEEIVNFSTSEEFVANTSVTNVELPVSEDKPISLGQTTLGESVSDSSDLMSKENICLTNKEISTAEKNILAEPVVTGHHPELNDMPKSLSETDCADNLVCDTFSEHDVLKATQTTCEKEGLIPIDNCLISKPHSSEAPDIESNPVKDISTSNEEITPGVSLISSLKASHKEMKCVISKNQNDTNNSLFSEPSNTEASHSINDCVALKPSINENYVPGLKKMQELTTNDCNNTNIVKPQLNKCHDAEDMSAHSVKNNCYEDANDDEGHATCNDKGNLSVNSEQNSCTESTVCNLKEDLSDVSCDIAFNSSKQSFIGKGTSLHNVNAKHPLLFNACEQGRSRRSLNLKRSISLPDSLDVKNKDKSDYGIHIGSNITLSDKATITSDFSDSVCEDCFSSEIETQGLTSPARKKSDNKSVASGGDMPLNNILFPLAVAKARMRNYVFGCKGLKGALLGNEELFRLFPQNKMTVFVGTWNMNGQDSPQNIDDFLLPLDVDTLPDIYAIGVQESMQSKSEWELLLQTTLGPSHVLFTSASLGVLHLAIFLRRDLIWFCSEPEEANIATRVGSMVKTKGAVAVCFMLFGTSLLFINSHLTAHEQNLGERISDYEKICSGLDLPRLIPVKTRYCKNVTSRFDCVFWCGDLNFRITWNRPAVLQFVKERIKTKKQSCDTLIKHDQLQKAIKEGTVFQGFKEGLITFNPSFKFDVGTNTFDSAKQRVPSYTDRILYRCKDASSVTCLHYNCVPEIASSDHKPVFGIFDVSLKPGRDNVPLAAGIFKRDVYLEALKRRANFLEVSRNQKQSAVCSVM